MQMCGLWMKLWTVTLQIMWNYKINLFWRIKKIKTVINDLELNNKNAYNWPWPESVP